MIHANYMDLTLLPGTPGRNDTKRLGIQVIWPVVAVPGPERILHTDSEIACVD